MKRKTTHRKLIVALAFVALALGSVGTLQAHTVGISRGEYRTLGTAINTELVLARPELLGAVPGLDVNRDGVLSQSELSAGRASVEDAFVHGLEVRTPAPFVPAITAFKSRRPSNSS
jgi:hypothetical protein